MLVGLYGKPHQEVHGPAGLLLEAPLLVTFQLEPILMEDYKSLPGLLIIQSYITRKPHQEVHGPVGLLLEAERLAIPL